MAEDSTAKPATLADVAERAGVSVPTASRVLNGGVRGGDSGTSELRDRVRSAARSLGYTPNRAAQATKGGRSQTVALLVGDIADSGAAAMIAGVMHSAEQRRLSVAVRATGDDEHREHALLTALRGERHRAVIVATSRTTDQAREKSVAHDLDVLTQQGTHVVVIGNSTLDFPRVTVDTVGAAAAFARALVARGARRFGVLAGPDNQITSRDRVTGLLNGLAECGIDATRVPIVRGEFSRDGGYSGLSTLIERSEPFDVIAAMSDAMAVGALVRARELGVSARQNVTITGFDGIPLIGDLLPTFSTVTIPLESFGEAALFLALESVTTGIDTITVKAQLVIEGQPVPIETKHPFTGP